MSFTLTTKARSDLKSIAKYTEGPWGRQQRNTYVTALNTAFEALALGKLTGSMQENISKNLLAQKCNSHLIFFRRTMSNDIEILRVLHERMDFHRHLK